MTEVLEQPSETTPEGFEQTTPYTVNETVDLLVNSYPFSQRDTILQELLLNQLVYNNPGKIRPETIREATPLVKAAVLELVQDPSVHAPISKGPIEKLVYDDVDERMKYLSTHLEVHRSENDQIAKSMIARDYKYLVSRGGRKRRSDEDEHTTPAKDPHISLFVYHGLMQQSTGIKEYDKIFADAAQAYAEHGASWHDGYQRYTDMLEKVRDVHVRSHSERTDPLPTDLDERLPIAS